VGLLLLACSGGCGGWTAGTGLPLLLLLRRFALLAVAGPISRLALGLLVVGKERGGVMGLIERWIGLLQQNEPSQTARASHVPNQLTEQ
jgi:hypothetical protein